MESNFIRSDELDPLVGPKRILVDKFSAADKTHSPRNEGWMTRRQPGSSGSHHVTLLLIGFRWLALILGLLLAYFDSGSRLALSMVAPVPGWLIAIGCVAYHFTASVVMLRLIDQPMTLYLLVTLDFATGALLTWFYGLNFFVLASCLPVVEAAYLSGAAIACFVALLLGLVDGSIIFNQVLSLVQNEPRLTATAPIKIREVITTRLMDLGGFIWIELLLIWVMAAIRGEEEISSSLRRKHREEKKLIYEELDKTSKEVRQAFNELSERDDTINRLKGELSEANDNLEKSLKKLHEAQSTLHAAQQKTQQREQQLATAHKRDMDEFKKEVDDAQRAVDRCTSLLEGFLIVNSSMHRDQAVMNIIEVLLKLVPSQTCLVYTVEVHEDQFELIPDGGASPYLEFLRNYTIKPGEGAVGWVAKRQEPIRIDKEQIVVEGEEVSTLVTYEKSAIIVPLEHYGRLLGAIYLGRPKPASYTQEDFDMAVQFARAASTTFNNVLTYQSTLAAGIFDNVTNVYNALYFDERLTEEVKRARRYQFPLSLILLDIDNFAHYNEIYGQVAGNGLLKNVAGILREHTRETDVVARLENDEFAVLLVESVKSNAIIIGERIRMALEVRSLGRANTPSVHITVSGGVASFPEESDSRESLIEKAASGLMQARRKGGNQIQY